MAFENVFRGIDWDAQNRGARQDQAMLMRSISQGIDAYQQGKNRELRQRQLDMRQQQIDHEMSKQPAFNLKQTAEQGLLAIASGADISSLPPEMQAAVKVYDAQRQGYTQDRFGNVIPEPSISGAITGFTGLGMQEAPQASGGKISNALNIAPVPASAVGGLPSDISTSFGLPSDTPPPVAAPQMQLQGAQAQSPLGQEIALRGQAELQKEAAKMGMQEQFEARKAFKQREKMKPKAEKALIDTFGAVENINKTVDKAISQVSPWSAGFGSWLSAVPATDAKDLQNTLKTIQADAAFGRLQQMRENSPSGGALGSVSERELALLGSAVTALEQDQTPQQLVANLNTYKQIRNNAFRNVLDAYEQDYGTVPKAIRKQFETDQQTARDNIAIDMGLIQPTGQNGGWSIKRK